MKARCTYCRLEWGIDIDKEIPRSGYECPWCAGKRKSLTRTAIQVRRRTK